MKKYLQKLDALGLLLLVVAVIWYSVSNIWGAWNLGLAIAGGIMVLIGLAANYRQILASFGKRSTKYAGNYVISVVLVIAIVFGVNYIGQKHTKRFDMTASGRFTLAPQTIQVLDSLDQKVDIKAFFPGGDSAPLRELLVEYRTESGQIEFEFIDPDRQPDVARQYDVSSYGVLPNPFTGTQIKYGTVIVSYGDRTEKIEKRSEEVEEEDLTNAIIKTTRTEAKKIYFVQGHGEKDPTASDNAEGYSAAREALEDEGYVVDTLVLAAEGSVPDDAKVLIMAGPELAPFPEELEFINDFLNKGGGGLLLLVDPSPAPSFDSLLKDWGIQADDDLVLDVGGAGRLMGTGPTMPLVIDYETHAITNRFDAMTFFPFTRSIRPSDEVPDNVSVEPLFNSSDNSWGETNFDNPEAEYNPEQDLEGPLSLAVAASKEIEPSSDEEPGINSRMVVAGTSNFSINAYFPQQGNGNLFLNMVSWLAQEEDLISIRPKPQDDRRMLLSQSQLTMIMLLSIVILPGIALVAGIAVVVNRRRR
jgi:ABC-type uncharacterized transport system involved in gliding motility auxiliary subunit